MERCIILLSQEEEKYIIEAQEIIVLNIDDTVKLFRSGTSAYNYLDDNNLKGMVVPILAL